MFGLGELVKITLLRNYLFLNQCRYSGLIIGESWQHLLLAAGTVFNQIVTWGTKGQETGGCCKVLHRLTGHKGVIFSINFNWEKRLLASVSDDRSLRLWRLVVPSGVSRDDVDWASVMFEAQHELYGHSARVWDCHLLPDNIVTIGEVGTNQFNVLCDSLCKVII